MTTPTSEKTSAPPTSFHPLRIAAIERLTDDAVAIELEVPEDLREDFAFEPGQHLTVRTALAGDDVRRNYSICTPAGQGLLRIGVKRLPGGAFSEHAMTALTVGTELEVMTPTGRFGPRLDPEQERSYGLVAAGSGITPLLSIAASVLATEPRSTVTLVYANRTQGSVMFVEDLEDLKNTYPGRLQIVHVLSRQPMDSELLSGRLDGDRMRRMLGTLVPADSVDVWYLCGPHAMVTELSAVLREHGADESAVHTELFHVEDAPPVRHRVEEFTDGGPSVTATLDGKTSKVWLTADDDSVLAGLLRSRPDAPFACRGGVCGTCRARVTDGAVQMRQNYALEPDELEQGYVLTCQSWPTTDTVTVDYDA
ncbi:MAG: 1,2-phenylacetyl-CoA epoxidase subunit PaaE [Nocardioidaceae bacterium]